MKILRVVKPVLIVYLICFISLVFAVKAMATDIKSLIEESEENEDQRRSMDELISLDLRGMDINDALKYLSVRGGINIVVSKNVSGRITFMLTDVPIRVIFDVILRSNNLAYEKTEGVYTVMTEKEYQARYGKQFSDIREVKVFRLDYVAPENAFTFIDALKSEIGRLVVDQESGTVLIMDTSEKIKEIEKAISILEKKNNFKIFELQYAKAKDVETHLKERIDAKNIGSIKADERSNQLIVQILPGRMNEIEQMIKALDQKTREVLIDTKIIKIALTDDSAKGIEWEGLFNKLSKGGYVDFIGSHSYAALDRLGQSFIDDFATRVASASDDFTDAQKEAFTSATQRIFTSTSQPTAGLKTTLSEQLYFGKVNEWEAVLSFLETLGETKILSNPKLVVVNNQEAKILVGQRQAYVTTTTTTGQTTSTISEDVTFIDVGIQLSVTPTINSEGYVRLVVKPEISSVVGTLKTPTNNLIPIVDTSMAETTVLVKDGSTIIIGGLRKEEKVTTIKRIPFFSQLPLIGKFFQNESHENETTELLILITPHILGGDILVTGNFDEVGEVNIKSYRDYEDDAVDKKRQAGPGQESLGGKIKLYRNYADYKMENE